MPLDQKDLRRILETAIVAARLAGQRAMEELNYIKVSKKGGTELVTQADARCQQIIIDRIKETYPDHGFIAEEPDQPTQNTAKTPKNTEKTPKNKISKQPPRRAEEIDQGKMFKQTPGDTEKTDQGKMFRQTPGDTEETDQGKMFRQTPGDTEKTDQGKMFRQTPRGAESLWWVIDPIDGTNNFAHKILLFTVSIAVMHEGHPIVGVIFEPATDSMFTAVKGGEAQLNSRRITANKEKMDKFSSVGLDSHFGNKVPKWAREIILRTRFRNLGSSALHFAYVAKGGFIAAITPRPKLWDIAAGVLIAQTAGAVVSDWKGGKIFPIDLDAYQGQRLQAIAANKKIHAELLKLLKS